MLTEQTIMKDLEQDGAWELRRIPGAKSRFRLLEEMWVERGDRADWDLLCGLHYKMQSTGVGAKYWRLRFRGETIGVCVYGMSKPLLKERHAIFPEMSPGHDTQISNIHRYNVVNDRFRVISRFVVDTMFRSGGAAYRFANLAARMSGFEFVEIQSSMSKYNLFAQRAGFAFAKPIKSHYYDRGLKVMRRYFEAHPGDQEALMQEFRSMSPALQRKVEHDLKAFYFDTSPLEKTGSRRHYSEGVVDRWPIRTTISKIQGLCFASPLYGIYRNPDAIPVVRGVEPWGGDLPAHLPLLAFDLQKPEEPLRRDQLATVQGWPALETEILARDWSAPTILPDGFKTKPEQDEESFDGEEKISQH